MTTTLMDRFARWNLDPDGDLYGDERERIRWYEGIAVTWQTQMILVPWVIAVLVWVLGRPAVLPLGVTLAVLLVPVWFTSAYVTSRRVDVTPLVWTTKRKLLGVLTGAPYAAFVVGMSYHLDWPKEGSWVSITTGIAVGLLIGVVMQAYASRRRRRSEAATIVDED